MKKMITLLSIISAFSVSAASVDCKIEARVAAADLYLQENPNSVFFVKTKYKAVREEKVIYQIVEIIDSENSGKIERMTVSLNPQTCSVLRID